MEREYRYLRPSTVLLGDASKRVLGDKAFNLYRLRELGFSVPAFWVVPSDVFATAVSPYEREIRALCAGIDYSDRASVERAAARIRELILRIALPNGLRQEVIRVPGGDQSGSRFAVRSSCIGEDSAANSFAGQMDSLLNQSARDVPDSIRKVWASAFSPRALLYRHRKGIGQARIAVAVIVQAMVPSMAGGVLFTRDPESRAKTCVVSAAYGLCDGVTGGAVESDTYRVAWDGDEISKRIPRKTRRSVANGAGGTKVEALPSRLRDEAVLSDRRIGRLCALGRDIERRFSAPQDIEWALDDRGTLWILQARPFTFPRRAAKARVWDNSNIVESYPGLTLPLTFSFARKAYEATFRGAMRRFLPFRRSYVDRLDLFDNMIGLLEGRVYYNLLNWYAMLSHMPGFRRHKPSWDRMIGISEETDIEAIRLPLPHRLCAAGLAVWRLITVGWTGRRFFARFDSVYPGYAGQDLASADEDRLSRLYRAAFRDFAGHWSPTVENDVSAMIYYDWLKKLCASWVPTERGGIHNDLLRGQSDMESLAPLESLIRLAGAVAAHPDGVGLFAEADNGAVLARIRGEKVFESLARALERHLRAFGDRGPEELKLEVPTFRESPERLIGLIRDFLERASNPDLSRNKERKPAAVTWSSLRCHLRNPVKRTILWLVLRNARRAMVNRENMRFARTRVFGFTRRIFRRMGEVLSNKGLLGTPDDVFFLTVEEIFDLTEGAAVTRDLKALVDLRKADYARFAKSQPAARIRTAGIPCLSPRHELEAEGKPVKSAAGIGCASGIADGTARVVFDPHHAKPASGHILVAKSTDPGWIFLMAGARGIIVEKGSVLSHSAIVGRELGIPTVVGVTNATKLIRDGVHIVIDGSTGDVRWR